MTWWQQGVDSGFNKCCIIWFNIRLTTLWWKRTPKFLRKLLIKMDNCTDPKGHMHVFCPICKLIYRFKKFTYWYCQPCDWYQFQGKRCHKCNSTNTVKYK